MNSNSHKLYSIINNDPHLIISEGFFIPDISLGLLTFTNIIHLKELEKPPLYPLFTKEGIQGWLSS